MSNGAGMRKLARIYKPSKTAMQSGRANTRKWILEFEPEHARELDPLMGWTSSRDTETQLRLDFNSREDAEAFCQHHEIAYIVQEPRRRKQIIKSYADNFRYTPPGA